MKSTLAGAAICLFPMLCLAGCASGLLSSSAPTAATTSIGSIRGVLHGGSQAVVGAHVYLYAAGTTGYGGPYTSLLTYFPSGSFPTTQDCNGNYYVTSDANGSFALAGEYSCVPGTQVYVFASGGNPGSGVNSAVDLMAILGQCPSGGSLASSVPFLTLNEVSTVAAAYAMAGFAADATHVGSSGTALAQAGIANAFLSASNLASVSTASALATTPAGNGAVAQRLTNTVANILAACVDSTGSSSSGCSRLFANARSQGQVATLSSAVPTETASAAIFIAQNPSTNVVGLYGLSGLSVQFEPALGAQPNDFTLGIVYSGNIYYVAGIAVDGLGNVWIADEGDSGNSGQRIMELSSTGAPVPGAPYTPAGLDYPLKVAIDTSNNAWVVNLYGGSITELSNTGVPYMGSPFADGGMSDSYGVAIDGAGSVWISNGYDNTVAKLSGGAAVTGSPFSSGTWPQGIAVDGAGSVWVSNYGFSISKLSNSGSSLSGAGYVGGGLNYPDAIAIDGSGDAWVANSQGKSVSKFTNGGTAVTGSAFTGGGLSGPNAIAIDGAGNAWISNQGTAGTSYSISEFNTAGVPVSNLYGFEGGCTNGCFNAPIGIAVDGSGNVWVANYGLGIVASANGTVTELIGAATPVITPIVAGLPALPTLDGSSRLGTRP